MIIVKEKDWLRVSIDHYKNINDVEFRCPSCGHVQSVNSLMKNNLGLTKKDAYLAVFSKCEGRINKDYGCDWTLYGLLHIHNMIILNEDGGKIPAFDFADKKVMAIIESLSVPDPVKEKEELLEVGTLWVCRKEFDVEPTSMSGNKPRKIKIGEIIEFRYPYSVNFRTVDDEYYHSNNGKFLANCDYYGKIKADIRFGNRHKLKQILEEKLYD